MNLTSKELKILAQDTLANRYITAVGAYVLIEIIVSAIILPFSSFSSIQTNLMGNIVYLIAVYLITLLSALFSCGLTKLLLAMIRKEPYQITDIFYCFKNHPDRFIIVAFIMSFPSFIVQVPTFFMEYDLSGNNFVFWGLYGGILILVMLISFIIYFNFALANLFLLDYQDMTPIEALKESSRLLKGNRIRLFKLVLSFLGMLLLCCLTFGLGLLWVGPYFLTTQCLFYLNLTNQLPTYDMRA